MILKLETGEPEMITPEPETTKPDFISQRCNCKRCYKRILKTAKRLNYRIQRRKHKNSVKYADNVLAIRTLKRIEKENRPATLRRHITITADGVVLADCFDESAFQIQRAKAPASLPMVKQYSSTFKQR